MPVNNKSPKISVEEETKREIGILAAVERRPEYEVVADMLKAYKAVVLKNGPRPRKIKDVAIADVISAH